MSHLNYSENNAADPQLVLQPFYQLIHSSSIDAEAVISQCGGSKVPVDWFSKFLGQLQQLLGQHEYTWAQLALINLVLYDRLGSYLLPALRQFLVDNFHYESADSDDESNDSDSQSSNHDAAEAVAMNEDTEEFQLTERLQSALPVLQQLNWAAVHSGVYLAAMQQLVQQKVADICSGEYDTAAAPRIDRWLQRRLFPYLEALSCSSNNNSNTGSINSLPSNSCNISSVKRQLLDCTIGAVADCRARELFDIVAEFPDSAPALRELRDCTAADADIIGRIGRAFRSALQRRLLHTGAATAQILDFYVSLVKAMRLLDSSDLLLQYVATPVRCYLKGRRDAVRCIVSSLTSSRDSELHGELKKGGNLAYGADEDDEEKGPGANWEPQRKNRDLLDASAAEATGAATAGASGGGGSSSNGAATGAAGSGAAATTAAAGGIGSHRESRGLDTLALLVSIYGSTDLFIVEYRSLLADKLLASSSASYATDSEVANLELLKIRFGEDSLHSCEVMLKDIEDSKRVNNAIHKKLQQQSTAPGVITTAAAAAVCAVDYTIISDKYWPSVPMDPVQYHPHIQQQLQQFSDTFADLKKPRKLLPAMLLGQVELELELLGGCVVRTFVVSPLQASIIMFFAEDGNEEISSSTDISSSSSSSSSRYNSGRYSSSSSSSSSSRPIRSLEQLAQLSELDDEDEVWRSAVMYWVNKGVIQEVADPSSSAATAASAVRYNAMGDVLGPARFFQLVEEEAQQKFTALDESMESESGAMQQDSMMLMAADAQQRAALVQIEGYVKGLLSSHGTMNLERIHTLLKLLSGGGSSALSDVNFDMNFGQLRHFLQALVDQHKLELIDGAYALCK